MKGMLKTMYKVGVFKIEYRKVKQGKRTVTKKVLFFIEEVFTKNETKTVNELAKVYRDWCYYFCEVKANEDYFFFPSRQGKMRTLKAVKGVEQ